MAILHHRLKQKIEEMKVYEKILILEPDNQEALFQLGQMYFEQGYRAKGLKIYLTLSALDREKSKQLIGHLGWDELQDEDLI